jgi:hypothetical protein
MEIEDEIEEDEISCFKHIQRLILWSGFSKFSGMFKSTSQFLPKDVEYLNRQKSTYSIMNFINSK